MNYRAHIRRACIAIGQTCKDKEFDWKDVQEFLDEHSNFVEDREIIREMQRARYLEIVERGDRHRRTRFKLRDKKRHINSSPMITVSEGTRATGSVAAPSPSERPPVPTPETRP